MKKYLLLLVLLPVLTYANIFPHILSVHPRPDARWISPGTQLLFHFSRNAAPPQHGNLQIEVEGTRSGLHSGNRVLSTNTLIFKPDLNFVPGETVRVTLSAPAMGRQSAFTYAFKINDVVFSPSQVLKIEAAEKKADWRPAPPIPTAGEPQLLNGVAVPSDFPLFRASVLKSAVADGRLFLNNWQGNPYILILENDGTPYFYQRVAERSRDFKVQPNGMLTRRKRAGLHAFVGMDSSYNVVATYQAAHGYGTDEHELVMTKDGHYYLIALGYRRVDMSELVNGGKKNADIIDNHVQGFDDNGQLVFEWLCHDYFDIVDVTGINLKANRIDYVHMNSVAVDYDGHIIISSKHLSEVTKINRQTGDIIWRLGGVNNQFTFTNDDHQISHQHHARPVPGSPDSYTIFDNGNLHQPRFSRGVEFKLNTGEMTATRVWEYRHPGKATGWMGNAQRLKNGNTLINWADGSMPKATEVTPGGKVVYEADFVDYIHCYRTFRFEWENPTDRPYLVAESLPDQVALCFNRFGAAGIEKYIIYGAPRRFLEKAVDTTDVPLARLTGLSNHTEYKFAVRSVNKKGELSPLSNIETVKTAYTRPGENYFDNGSFDKHRNSWELKTSSGANARFSVRDEACRLFIYDGGHEVWHVQLLQEGIPLVRGKKYRFEFDGHADAMRTIDAKLERSGSPWENYGKIGPTQLRKTEQHYVYDFSMQDPTDYKARVVFNCGGSDKNVYLDNVSLIELLPQQVEPAEIPDGFELAPNYPNPFNPVTTLSYHLPVAAAVELAIYNTLGKRIHSLVREKQREGSHQIKFDASGLASGVYFCRLCIRSGRMSGTRIRKMMLLK